MNWQRARAHAALVATAVDLRLKANAGVLLTDVQCADSLRGVYLVARKTQQVDPHFLDVDGDLADRLHRVGVEQDGLFLAEFADRLDWLQRADLVVRRHDRNEDRLVRHRVANLIGGYLTESIDGQIRDLAAFLFEALARVEDRLVLGRLRDDV